MKACIALTAVLLLCITGSIRAADEDGGIQAVWKQFLDAWNRHDVHEFSLVFAPDADLTNWRGEHIRGQAAIEERFRPMFSGPIFKDSLFSGKVRMIRFLRPDIAIVDIDWEMTGARSADGSPRPRRRGILDLICERQRQDWRIVAFHDTDFTAASITK